MLNGFVGAGVLAAAASAAVLSAGSAAAAPDVVGQTYNDAKQTIQQTGATAIIATRTGSVADESSCVVTNAWDKSQVTGGRNQPSEQVMVALNCNASVATAGSPGNSAASPEGRQALASADDAS
jgi:beta-lactam-binding protein with PASTA domain